MASWTSSSGVPPFLREVKRGPGFDDDGIALVGSIELFDEVIRPVEWVIARAPFLQPRIGGTSLRLVKTTAQGPHKVPALRVFFTVETDGSCTMRFVEEMPEEEL